MIRDLPLRYLVPAFILLVGAASVSVFVVTEIPAVRDQVSDEVSDHIRVVGMIASGEIEAALRGDERGEMHTAMEAVQSDPELVDAAVVGPEGELLSATRLDAVGKQFGDGGFESLRALVDRVRESDSATLRTVPGDRIQAVFPLMIRRDEQALLPDARGFLLMEYDFSRRLARHYRELFWDVVSRAASIAVLSLGLWLFFHFRLLKRVRRLVKAARRIGEGEFSAPIADNSRDELGGLAGELRSMARRLEHNTRELSYQALHDNLTGMLNRWGFERHLEHLVRELPHDERTHALVYLDLDQFRVVNDTWGHSAGDELIRQLSKVLRQHVFVRDRLARLGGDEFGILLENCTSEQARSKAEAIREAVDGFRFEWQGETLQVTASFGVVPVHRGMGRLDQLLSLADTACYAAKEGGRDRVHVWQAGDEELERRHGEMRWVSRIQLALEEDRFVLHAQPIVPTASAPEPGALRYEVLVRMLDERGRLAPPGEFLTAAERYHLAPRIDRWVIARTLETLFARPDHVRNLKMCAINLSGLSLNDPGLHEYVQGLLDRTGPMLPHKLCFEITETAAITNLGRAAEFIGQLRDVGCTFALDDFGSGVSSFGYLKNLPVDYIKIDGMFVRDMLDDPVDRAVVRSINEVAHEMGKETIAEFVESKEILAELGRMGVDYGQGFGIQRPCPLEQLIDSGKFS